MIIQHNMPAMNARRNLGLNNNKTAKNLEKLSSGYRINRSADDAAGLGISEKMRAMIRESAMAQNNAKQGLDASKTADGALNEISAMLVRARELTVQAANDTYDAFDRAQIQKEIKSVFEEITRISIYTNHNEISLLRFENTTTEGLPILGMSYLEHINPTQTLSEWGVVDIVDQPEQLFDLAGKAKNATVTFKLDDDIDLNDATTLNGKSFTIAGYRFDFSTGSGLVFPNGTKDTAFTITAGQTVEEYLKNWAATSSAYDRNWPYTYYSIKDNWISDVSVNTATREITFSAPLTALSTNVNGLTYLTAQGNGSAKNGLTASSAEQGNLDQVSGAAGAYDQSSLITNGNEYYQDFTFGLKASYTAADIANLVQNTLTVNGKTVSFKDSGADVAGSSYVVTAGMTAAQMSTKLQQIFADCGVTVTSPALSGTTLTFTGTAVATDNSVRYVQENRKYTSTTWDSSTWSIGGMAGASATKTQNSTSEQGEIWQVTVPTYSGGSGAFQIGGYSIVLYNSDDSGKDSSYTIGASGTYTYNIKGKTDAEIQSWINSTALTAARNAANNAYGAGYHTTTISGNKVTIKSSLANTSKTISAGSSSSYGYYQKVISSGGYTPYVLTSSTTYFDRDISLEMQLATDGSGNIDLAGLDGTGFTFSVNGTSTLYEFNAGGAKVNSGSTLIDISSAATIDDVATAMENAIKARYSGKYKDSVNVTSGADGKVTVSMDATTYQYYEKKYINGNWQYDGMFTNDGAATVSKSYTGGTDTKKPYTTVDFSSVTEENMIDDLLGKGFRIKCASCENEYHNILFRWSNDPPSPDSYSDVDADGVTPIDIKNYVVELSKIKNPSQIVSSIVSQLTPHMDHYQNVRADPNNPSILIVEDKRPGDLPMANDPTKPDPNQRGKLLPGLYTNFEYSYEEDPIYGPPATEIEYRNMPIYVSSVQGSGHYINLRLPNISLATLGLWPPDLEITDRDDANDWLVKIDQAAIDIAEVRGVLGADHNRLEHALNNLGVTKENLQAAESSIRDLDMAKEMMEFTKNNILSQSAQAMLAQANQLPQGVVQLLR